MTCSGVLAYSTNSGQLHRKGNDPCNIPLYTAWLNQIPDRAEIWLVFQMHQDVLQEYVR